MDTFMLYLKDEQDKCKAKELQLLSDRKDEANLCKIQYNVYGIFEALYKSAQKAGKISLFTEKATSIPAVWKQNYETAKQHQDSEQILIEEVKLQTVDKIMKYYDSIKE